MVLIGVSLAGPSGVILERSYGVRGVNGAGASGPAVCGFGFGGGSAPAVVDVCVATHMRGLVPHDRVCEMRSGADLWRRAWPPMRLLTAFPRIAPRVGSPVRSPRRAVEGGATPSSRAPSSVRRAHARLRPRLSSAACLGPRARSSARAVCARSSPLGLARRATCRCVCVPA